MPSVEWLTQKLLQDRELAKQREASRTVNRQRSQTDFEIAEWPTIPGRPKTYMRQGRIGFHIFCETCGNEFESIGLRYCEKCMKLPAEDRRAVKPIARGR